MSGRVRRRAELGQHFLAGGRLAAELVEQAGVEAGDLMVEIGAGTGVLTEALAQWAGQGGGRRVRPAAGRAGPGTAGRVRQRARGDGDALALPLPGRPFRVVANLPFGSSAAILRRLLGEPRTRLERADLVLQEEAARRYAARRPGTPETIAWGPGTTLPTRPAGRPAVRMAYAGYRIHHVNRQGSGVLP